MVRYSELGRIRIMFARWSAKWLSIQCCGFIASGTDMTGSVNCMLTFKVAPVSSIKLLQAQWSRYFYGAGNQFNRD